MKTRSFLLWFVAITVVLILVIMAVIRLLLSPDRVIAELTPKLEESFGREVQYGDVEFTIFTGVGVRIHDLTLRNKPGFGRENLIETKTVDCQVKFWQLFAGRIVIDRLILREPKIHLIKDADGNQNFGPDLGAEGSNLARQWLSFPFSFEEFDLLDGQITYQNDSLEFQWTAANLNFESKVSEGEPYRLEGELEADSLRLVTAEHDYLLYPAGVRFAYRMRYAPEDDSLTIETSDWSLDWLHGKLAGWVSGLEDEPFADLHVIAPKIPLKRFHESRSAAAFERLRELELDGDLRIDATYEGNILDPRPEELSGKVSFSQVKLNTPRLRQDLRINLAEVNFDAQSFSFFTEGATIGDQPLTLHIALDDFSDPKLSLQLQFAADVNTIKTFLFPGDAGQVSGQAIVNLSGFLPLSAQDDSRLVGSLDLIDFSYRSSKFSTDIERLNLSGQFLGKDVEIQRLEMESGENDLKLSGKINGIAAYVSTRGRPQTRPFFDFELNSKFLNLDQLSGQGSFGGDTLNPPQNLDSLRSWLSLLPDFDASGHIAITGGLFSEVPFSELAAHLTVIDHIFSFDSVTSRAFDGRLRSEMILDLSDSLRPQFEIEYVADRVDVDAFLLRFAGLKGLLAGDADLSGGFKASGWDDIDILSSLEGKGEATIVGAQIESFGLAQTLWQRFGFQSFETQQIEDLIAVYELGEKRVRFDTLDFRLGETPYRVRGDLGFDGRLDLYLEMTLSEELVRHLKVERRLQELLRDLSEATVSLHLGGTSEEPTFDVIGVKPKDRSRKGLIDKANDFFRELLEN